MSQKIAYVTGGMGGIGTAICRSLHQRGFKVIAGCGPTRDHAKWLAEQKALSQSDLDNATGSYEEAVAAVHAAQAKVHSAEINLGYTTVRSPLDGAAGRAIHREGAYVGGAADTAQLTYVAALDPIWVTFSISQNQHSAYLDMVEKKQIVTPKGDNYEIEIV